MKKKVIKLEDLVKMYTDYLTERLLEHRKAPVSLDQFIDERRLSCSEYTVILHEKEIADSWLDG